VKNRRSLLLAGAMAAGLLLTQQACSPASDPVPAAVASPASDSVKLTNGSGTATDKSGEATKGSGKTTNDAGSTGTQKAGKSSILAGKRQVVIKPNPSSESIVAYDAKGRLSLIDGEAEHSLFVLTPAGDKFLVKTAKATSGGEPDCAGIKSNGSASLTVVAAPCDASRSGQLFTITEQKKNANGEPTYAISISGAFLQVGRSGLIAEELGDSTLKTTFSFIDNGPATLPILD